LLTQTRLYVKDGAVSIFERRGEWERFLVMVGRVFYLLFFNCPRNESCGNIKGGASQEGRGGQEWEESVFFRHPDKE